MARALYSTSDKSAPPPMAGLNLFALAESNTKELDVWPENALAVSVFIEVQTQWRVGFGGATGLDYTAVLAHIASMRLHQHDADDLYADLRVMELAALAQMAESRENDK